VSLGLSRWTLGTVFVSSDKDRNCIDQAETLASRLAPKTKLDITAASAKPSPKLKLRV